MKRNAKRGGGGRNTKNNKRERSAIKKRGDEGMRRDEKGLQINSELTAL